VFLFNFKIKSADLIDIPGSLDHVDLERFYEKFTYQIYHKKNQKGSSVREFLKGKKAVD